MGNAAPISSAKFHSCSGGDGWIFLNIWGEEPYRYACM